MRIAALATGIGNIRSVLRALDRAIPGDKVIIATADIEEVRRADVLVVPGQGSFGAFATAIDTQAGLRDVLVERIDAGIPYLGICLGLQILFEDSEEAPGARGLGVFRGSVKRLVPGVDPENGRALPLPHMGWNVAEPTSELQGDLVPRGHYYFAHTFAAAPADEAIVTTTTRYGDARFASSVGKNAIVGVQFHPEKSQVAGLSLITSFFARLKK